MAQTLMACLPCLTRTCSWVSMVRYMRLLWPNFCVYVFILLFSVSVFSDQWSLKIENEINYMKIVPPEVKYMVLESLELSL